MTLLPQVERELVEAAARHYASPRHAVMIAVKTRVARSVVAVGVTVALIAVISTTVTHWTAEPETELRPSQAGRSESGAVPSLATAYDVFRRPRARTDAIPALDQRVTHAIERPGVALQLQESRLLASGGGYEYYAVPAIGPNGANLCILNVEIGSNGAGGGCGTVDDLTKSQRPYLSTTTRPGNHQEAFLLVRDGIDRIQLELRDGRRISAQVRSNAVLMTVKPGIESITWTDEGGRSHEWALHDDPVDTSD